MCKAICFKLWKLDFHQGGSVGGFGIYLFRIKFVFFVSFASLTFPKNNQILLEINESEI